MSPQAAKGLGQTLRAFQPTIKEVVEVSQEIKGTLEQVRVCADTGHARGTTNHHALKQTAHQGDADSSLDALRGWGGAGGWGWQVGWGGSGQVKWGLWGLEVECGSGRALSLRLMVTELCARPQADVQGVI